MIAKFHSAPGHSMETTLTINIPPPDRIRAAKGEKLKQKEKNDVMQGSLHKGKEKDREEEKVRREKEKDEEKETRRKEERERENELREKLERERRALAERGSSYKEKFQTMREKYDKATNSHENHIRELEVLTAKLKSVQAENDLLLDAMFVADAALYDRHFLSGAKPADPPLTWYPHLPTPPLPSGSPSPLHSDRYGQAHIKHQGTTSSSLPAVSRSVDYSTQSASVPSSEHPPAQSRSHGHSVHIYPQYHDRQGQLPDQINPHPYYVYQPRHPVPPEAVQPSAHAYYGQHSQVSSRMDYLPSSRHYGMPPPPLPAPITEAEQERDGVRVRERECVARKWDWEAERDRLQGSVDTMPPPSSLGPTGTDIPTPSSGYNVTPNGHLYGNAHGDNYPPPVTRTHAKRPISSRSSSRRRGEEMEMEMDVDIPPSPDADVDMSLGGPVDLEVDLKAARERGREGRPSLSQCVEHDKRDCPDVIVEGMIGGSQSQNVRQAPRLHTTRPMAALEPDPPPSQHYRVIHERRTLDDPISGTRVHSSPELSRHEREGEVHLYGSDPEGDFARGRPRTTTQRYNSYASSPASRSISWKRGDSAEDEIFRRRMASRGMTAPSGGEGTSLAFVGIGLGEEGSEEEPSIRGHKEEQKEMGRHLGKD